MTLHPSSDTTGGTDTEIPAVDGFRLAASRYESASADCCIVLSSATAVPRQFYRHYAAAAAEAGFTTITFDYRGIGDSRPASLRGFEAKASDWALLDMAGVVDWAAAELSPHKLFLVGHSIGGQVAGMLDNSQRIDGMLTTSAQSGFWGAQVGAQRTVVALHAYLTMPLLAHMFGYMPWSKVGSAEDLPKGVALQWARWCRQRNYLLDDESLPLHRYRDFKAPVLAYSIDDDDWGSARAVDDMMSAYPNLERRHLIPKMYGLQSLGHFGYYRPGSQQLWREGFNWFDSLTGKIQED